MIVLALNCGSSSLKFQADEERVIAQGCGGAARTNRRIPLMVTRTPGPFR